MLWERRGNAVNIESELVRKLPRLKAFVGEHRFNVGLGAKDRLTNRTCEGAKSRTYRTFTARYRLLPPVTVSSSRPDEDRSTRAEVSRILDRHTLWSGIDLEGFDIERINESVDAQIATTPDATWLHHRAIHNDARVAFPADEHRRRGAHGHVTRKRAAATDSHARHPLQKI